MKAIIETRLNEKTGEFYDVTIKETLSTPEKRKQVITSTLKKLFKNSTVLNITYYKETSYNVSGESIYWHFFFDLNNELSMHYRQSLNLDNEGRIELNLHTVFV